MFHKFIISPMAWVIGIIYLSLYAITGNYGISLFLLSIVSSILMILLGKLFAKYSSREAEIQSILLPQMQKIKNESSGDDRHIRISKLYQRYGYHPILAIRSAMHLFIQLPFLIGAYYMLSHYAPLQGVRFLFLNDLSAPDGILWGINLLPLLMTAVNITTTIISNDFRFREKIQAFCIALLFLALLYHAASALLLFWTTNNIIFLGRTIVKRLRTHIVQETKAAPSISLRSLVTDARHFIKTRQWVSRLITFFAYLLLFYLYQYAIYTRFTLDMRISKMLPFCVVAFSLFILLLKVFFTNRRLTLKKNWLQILIFMAISAFVYIVMNPRIKAELADYSIQKVLILVALIFTLSSLVLVIFDRRPLKKPSFMTNKFIFSFLTVFSLIPIIHMASSNTDYLKGIYYLYYFLFFIAIAILNYCWGLIFAYGRLNKSQVALHATIFSFLFMLLPIFRNYFALGSGKDIDFWLLFGGFLFLATFAYSASAVKKIMTFGIILFTVTVISSSYNLMFHTHLNRRPPSAIPLALQNIQFHGKPNIYLLIYDGTPNERVFQEEKLPYAKVERILKSHGFKIYNDTYTMGTSSLLSMAETLNLSDKIANREDPRDIYSGNSVINQVLRKQGYNTHLLLMNQFTGAYAINNKSLVDEFYPPREAVSVNTDFLYTLIRGIMLGEFKFDIYGLAKVATYSTENRQIRKHELIVHHGEKQFVVEHFEYPCHSQMSGKLLPDETQQWIKRLGIAERQMKKDMDDIQKYDPSAIVIAIGDHGPRLTSDGVDMIHLKKNQITPNLIWDRLGTMVAIRWPDKARAALYDRDLKINQDIFAVVLAYLSDDPRCLTVMPGREFSGYKTFTRAAIHFKDGELLNK